MASEFWSYGWPFMVLGAIPEAALDAALTLMMIAIAMVMATAPKINEKVPANMGA